MYILISQSIYSIFPIVVYHKSFKITFQVIDAANSAMPSLLEIEDNLIESEKRSFPSLNGDYLIISNND